MQLKIILVKTLGSMVLIFDKKSHAVIHENIYIYLHQWVREKLHNYYIIPSISEQPYQFQLHLA